MHFFIHSQRFCPRTLIVAQRYRNYLIANGWKPSLQPDADLILIFGCDFSMEERDYALAQLRKYRALSKPDAKLLLTGCLPSVRKDLNVTEPGSYVFGLEEAGTMDQIIGATVPFDQTPVPNVLSRDLYEYGYHRSRATAMTYFVGLLKKGRSRVITDHWTLGRLLYRTVSFRPDQYAAKYYLLLSTGCLSDCSYCSEKYVFKTHTSRPEDQIVAEFRAGLEKGYTLFTLEAFDTGTYGFDIRTDLMSLLARLHDYAKPDTRMEILNLNPQYLVRFFPRLIEFLKSGRIRLVQVPVQSGSNRVLGLMNRPYAIEDFRECVARMNADFPQVLLDTHFIVGHPGERESDFQESLRIIRDLKFDKITGFAFEPKENTLSITMPEQVSPHDKKRRVQQLWNTALRAHVRRTANI